MFLGFLSWAVASEGQAEPNDTSALRALVEADWIEQDRLFAESQGAAADQPAVTTTEDASGGCDGVKNGRWGFHTASGETDPWWQVDLGREAKLDGIVVFNRVDRGCAPRTKNLVISVASDCDGREFETVYRHKGEPFFGVSGGEPLVVDLRGKDISARVVRLSIAGKCSFALDEIEVYGSDDPKQNLALENRPIRRAWAPIPIPERSRTESIGQIHRKRKPRVVAFPWPTSDKCLIARSGSPSG